MARNIPFAPREYYHIYNRGTEKRDIFLDTADYRRFITLLYTCNGAKPVHLQFLSRQGRTLNCLSEIERGEPLIHIGAYCLMPNHFHILMRESEDEPSISKFMQKLCTGYTMYFNKRYERSGALFQGKFKSSYAGDDTYLKYLFSYIHLNPVKLIDPLWKENGVKNKNKTKQYLDQYQYSSYVDYAGHERDESAILSPKVFPEYFTETNDFIDNTYEWLSYESDIKVEP